MRKLVILFVFISISVQAGIYINYMTQYGLTGKDGSSFIRTGEVAEHTLLRVVGARDFTTNDGATLWDFSTISTTGQQLGPRIDDDVVYKWYMDSSGNISLNSDMSDAVQDENFDYAEYDYFTGFDIQLLDEEGGDFYVTSHVKRYDQYGNPLAGYAAGDYGYIFAGHTLVGHDYDNTATIPDPSTQYDMGGAAGGLADDVIPEPATAGLIGIASTGIVMMRSKRRIKVPSTKGIKVNSFNETSKLRDKVLV